MMKRTEIDEALRQPVITEEARSEARRFLLEEVPLPSVQRQVHFVDGDEFAIYSRENNFWYSTRATTAYLAYQGGDLPARIID